MKIFLLSCPSIVFYFLFLKRNVAMLVKFLWNVLILVLECIHLSCTSEPAEKLERVKVSVYVDSNQLETLLALKKLKVCFQRLFMQLEKLVSYKDSLCYSQFNIWSCTKSFDLLQSCCLYFECLNKPWEAYTKPFKNSISWLIGRSVGIELMDVHLRRIP